MTSLHRIDFRSKAGKYIRSETSLGSKELKKIISVAKPIDIISITRGIKILKMWTHKLILNKINNTEFCNARDFCTLEPIDSIDKDKIVIYTDETGRNFAFELMSIFEWIKRGNKNNPFTNNGLLKNFCEQVLIRGEKAKVEYEPHRFKQHKYRIRSKAIDLFHEMDLQGYYTNVCWFTELKVSHLKKWYYNAQDIWYYRAKLTEEQRNKIAPKKRCFLRNVDNVKTLSVMQNIVLNEIEQLITSSPSTSSRATGCIYILLAFASVHSGAAETLAWLSTD